MKIKLIIFDLDGVLCDTRDWHYFALNAALTDIDPKYVISKEEHLSTYDGLPTTKKLKLLTQYKGLPEDMYETVWKMKQDKTIDVIEEHLPENKIAQDIMKHLSKEGYKIAVASNSIRSTVRVALDKMGLMRYVDYYYSNQDVRNPKPNTEMYMKAMIDCEVDAKETVIIEDSHIGRQAVLHSGAHLLAIRVPEDLTLKSITGFIESLNGGSHPKPKWHGGEMNVLIPIAGEGHSFQAAGYTFPKPLIEIEGKPMVQLAIENLNIHAHHIFIVKREHYDKYNMGQLLKLLVSDCSIIICDSKTAGAASTSLLAKDYINNEHPLVIANADQYIEWDSNEFMYSMTSDNVDGGVATFTSLHPKWSFVKLNERGFVGEVAEKLPISNIATCGVYYWSRGSDYVKYAEQMIQKNITTNDEFFIAPVYNEAIADGKVIKTYPVSKMWGLGTPEDVHTFVGRNRGES